jgi:hypothetical protein
MALLLSACEGEVQPQVHWCLPHSCVLSFLLSFVILTFVTNCLLLLLIWYSSAPTFFKKRFIYLYIIMNSSGKQWIFLWPPLLSTWRTGEGFSAGIV